MQNWPWTSVDLSDDNLMMTHELLAVGYDDKAITRMVRRGELHRIRHGAYTYGGHWAGLAAAERRLLTTRAVLRSARMPTIASGPSAADAYGVPVWDLGDEVHVARLDATADRRQAGRVPHRGLMLAEDVAVRRGLPVTSGTRTALDVAMMTDPEHALVIIDGLLHAGETSRELLERRAAGMIQHPHSLALPIVLGLADGRHESAGETRSSWMMWRHHLPRPIPQYEIFGRGGRLVARVDFAWPHLRTFMEFDGKEKYLRHRRPGESVADAVLRERRREQLICGLTSWRCMRTIWADLYLPERTVARIAATLAGEPWAA